jgi:hypothetical protein
MNIDTIATGMVTPPMKICAICESFEDGDASTCSQCGEASWAMSDESNADDKKGDGAPADDTQPHGRRGRRGRP